MIKMSRVIQKIEEIEDRIESMKWLLTKSAARNSNKSNPLNIIRESSGILPKSFPKGTTYENKMRKQLGRNLVNRTSKK